MDKKLPPKANGKKRIRLTKEDYKLSSAKEKLPKIIVSAFDLYRHSNIGSIKFNKGMTAYKFLGVKEGGPKVMARIIAALTELMILDVINGDKVFFNKKMNASFSVNGRPILDSFFDGESHPNTKQKIPKLDVVAAGFKYPIIVIDPGREKDRLMLTVVPRYLFALLIDNVNGGKKYSWSRKEYILNTLNRELLWDDKNREWVDVAKKKGI